MAGERRITEEQIHYHILSASHSAGGSKLAPIARAIAIMR
jgi:hypothetical protein